MDPLKDGSQPLSDVLTQEHKIPKYQRKYAWKERQIVELWEDLVEYHENKDADSKYIFGEMIVYRSSDKKTYVIDGQQRLTTSYILLAAARKIIDYIYPDRNTRKSGVQKYHDLLYNHTFSLNYQDSEEDVEDEPFLTVNNEYSDEFKDIINLKPVNINNDSSNYYAAYKILLNKIFYYITSEEPANNAAEPNYSSLQGNSVYYRMLRGIIDSFLGFVVLYVTVNKLSDAYRIFDSINTRGIRLEFTDLVKNYIFTKCYSTDAELHDDDYSLEEDWKSIVNTMGEDFTTFFRYVLIAKYGVVREELIMATVKKHISTPQKIKEFIKELKKSTKIYLFMVKKQKLFDDEEINRIIHGITESKKTLTVYAPLILSFYLHDYKKELNLKTKEGQAENKKRESRALLLIKAIDTLLVRGFYSGIRRSNYYEDDFGSLSEQYYSEKIDFRTYVKKIYGLCESDDLFKAGIISKDWTNIDARYILTELYNRTYPTNVVKVETDIEHILPQEIKKAEGWGHFTEEMHKKTCLKIGNLILLEKGTNRKIKNKPFSVKVEKYIEKEKNLLDINIEEVITKTEWTGNEIDSRSISLADDMITHWPKKADVVEKIESYLDSSEDDL